MNSSRIAIVITPSDNIGVAQKRFTLSQHLAANPS